MLKIRSSPHGSNQNAHEAQCAVENNVKFHHQSTLDENRNQPAMNSIKNYTPGEMQSPLQMPDLPISTENREESQPVETFDSTLEQTVNNAPIAPTTPNSYWIVQENGEEQPRVYR